MKHYWMAIGLLLGMFLMLFVIVETLGVPLLDDPSPWLDERGWLAVPVGFGLLVVDVVLPVPSSLVMIAHGALFGVLPGTLLSLVGSTGATLAGFWVGRRGGSLVARITSTEERDRADRLLRRWGVLAIVITRPVPLLAETTAILAGTSSMSWNRVLLAGAAGSLPAALLYALAGAAATTFQNGVLVFGSVILIAGVFWLATWLVERRSGEEEGRLVGR